MARDLNSVVLECKKIYVKYQITIVFCALYACCQENLPYFVVKMRQLWVDTSRLSSLPLSCVDCLQLLVVCSCYVEVGRMLKTCVSAPCVASFWSRALSDQERLWPHFSFSHPAGWKGNQQWCCCRMWTSSYALPLPASLCLPGEGSGFWVLTGTEVGLELLRWDVPWSQPAGM